jgi:hypothetical protein
MARKRYQKGQVFLSGKNKDKWIGRYREDVIGMDGITRRLRRDGILGTKRELPTKRLAQRRLDASSRSYLAQIFIDCRIESGPPRLAST